MLKAKKQSLRIQALMWLQIEETAANVGQKQLARHMYGRIDECLQAIKTEGDGKLG